MNKNNAIEINRFKHKDSNGKKRNPIGLFNNALWEHISPKDLKISVQQYQKLHNTLNDLEIIVNALAEQDKE